MSIPKLNIIFFRNCDLDLFILSTPSTKSHSVNSTLLSTKITFHFSPNKNKIPQLGHSQKPLENLILSTLQQFLFIHPRHQYHALHMKLLGYFTLMYKSYKLKYFSDFLSFLSSQYTNF